MHILLTQVRRPILDRPPTEEEKIVNSNYIKLVEPYSSSIQEGVNSLVRFTDGGYLYVKETPNEILRRIDGWR